ncbi:hypothetical protein BDQ12DRAFT_730059 [Crucibulum laeve]|uniref:Uncharacterized protein n=1 Tax=Crucibulum laeve TaxID=68775 RepID=A0A5C3LE70_9AGAR|nr:hypothetical protein BDQ12DRAFT_730059 [Crucibulum laeve]
MSSSISGPCTSSSALPSVIHHCRCCCPALSSLLVCAHSFIYVVVDFWSVHSLFHPSSLPFSTPSLAPFCGLFLPSFRPFSAPSLTPFLAPFCGPFLPSSAPPLLWLIPSILYFIPAAVRCLFHCPLPPSLPLLPPFFPPEAHSPLSCRPLPPSLCIAVHSFPPSTSHSSLTHSISPVHTYSIITSAFGASIDVPLPSFAVPPPTQSLH